MINDNELLELMNRARLDVAGQAWLVNALDCLTSDAGKPAIQQRFRVASKRFAAHPGLDAMTPPEAVDHAINVLEGDSRGTDVLSGRPPFQTTDDVFHVCTLSTVTAHHINSLTLQHDDFPLAMGFQDATFTPRDFNRVDTSFRGLVENRLACGQPGITYNVHVNATLRGRLPVVWLTPDDPLDAPVPNIDLGNAVRDSLALGVEPECTPTDQDKRLMGKDLWELCLVVYQVGDGSTLLTLHRPTVLSCSTRGYGRFRDWYPGGEAATYGCTFDLSRIQRGERPCDGLREAVAGPIPVTPAMLKTVRYAGFVFKPYREDPHRDDAAYLEELTRGRALEQICEDLLKALTVES